MIPKMDTRKIDALDQWRLRMLLGIKWYQFVRNNDVRRVTKQLRLTAVIPYAPRSSRFGSEPPSVEDDEDVWHYAILESHATNDDDDTYVQLICVYFH